MGGYKKTTKKEKFFPILPSVMVKTSLFIYYSADSVSEVSSVSGAS